MSYGGFRRRSAGSGSRRSKSGGVPTSSLSALKRRMEMAEAKNGKAPDRKSAAYGYEVEARNDRSDDES